MRKILVADDDADIREVIALVLAPDGFAPLLAADGLGALELARAHPDLDLMIVDLMMPRMSGAEFIAAVRNDGPASCAPIVVLSGDNAARETARAVGAAACLRKPVDLDELLATVDALTR